MGVQHADRSKQAKPQGSSLRQKQNDRAPGQVLHQLQRTIGNQGVSRLLGSSRRIQPKCACGGSCPRCQQANSKISQPGDVYEREADRVADRVMRMPIPQVQREAAGGAGQSAAPSRPVAGTLRGGGRPLSDSTRSYFEPRFGHDFSPVRVHSDAAAADAAHHLRARAFTYGRHVTFGAGQYSPGTTEGRRLLAHELTHVVQQGGGAPGAGMPQALSIQRSADPMIQRAMTVDPTHSIPLPHGVMGPPEPLTNAVERMMSTTCPAGKFQVNPGTGAVTVGVNGFCQPEVDDDPAFVGPLRSPAASSATPVGCECLCDVVDHARVTTVEFHPGSPSETPGAQVGSGPGQGGVQTDPTVRIDPRFQGQYRINGHWVDVPIHLLFSHELCGHALPGMRGTHAPRRPRPAGGTALNEMAAVTVERQIAAEGGHPQRPWDYSAARQKP